MFQSIARLLGFATQLNDRLSPEQVREQRVAIEQGKAAIARLDAAGIGCDLGFVQGAGIGNLKRGEPIGVTLTVLRDLIPDFYGFEKLVKRHAGSVPVYIRASGITHSLEGYIGEEYSPRTFSPKVLRTLCDSKPGMCLVVGDGKFLGPFENSNEAWYHAMRTFDQNSWQRVIRLGSNPEFTLQHAYQREESEEPPFVSLKQDETLAPQAAEQLRPLLKRIFSGALQSVLGSENQVQIRLEYGAFPNLTSLRQQLGELFPRCEFDILVALTTREDLADVQRRAMSAQLLAELTREHQGKFVYLCGEEVIGPFPSFDEAVEASARAFPIDRWGEVIELVPAGSCRAHNNVVAGRSRGLSRSVAN